MVSDALSLDLMMAHGNDGAVGIKGEGGGGMYYCARWKMYSGTVRVIGLCLGSPLLHPLP